ncbi:hypothetical protein PQX77_005549 [Marasmius sp. AFHP31]|nr:hypothetical protein PQX77_005549 [Marasmius sp. AFHP31]
MRLSDGIETRRESMDKLRVRIGGYELAIHDEAEESLPLCRWQRMSKEELDDIHQRIQDLEVSQLGLEHNPSTEIQGQVNEYKNFLSPIRRLPYEVISIILPLAFEENAFASRRHSRCDSSLLSAVCTHWRMVALSTPSMWSFISCDIKITSVDFERVTPAIQTYLRRSGDATLHYTFKVYLPNPEVRVHGYSGNILASTGLFRLLLEQHYHRVGCIEVNSRDYIPWSLVHKILNHFPPNPAQTSVRLKSLHFRPHSSSSSLRIANLEHSPRSSITSLTITAPFLLDVRDVLRGFPNLVSLDITLGGAPRDNTSAPAFTLTHLTHLTLRRTDKYSQFGELIRYFCTPSLEVLSVSSGILINFVPGGGDPTDYLPSLVDLIMRSRSSLREFDFRDERLAGEDLVVVLEALPNSLGRLGLSLFTSQSSAVERLNLPSNTADTMPVLLPNLTDIYLDFEAGDDGVWGSIVEFLQTKYSSWALDTG